MRARAVSAARYEWPMYIDATDEALAISAGRNWAIPKELVNHRLDLALARLATISRSQAKSAIEAGQVSLDKVIVTSPRHAVMFAQQLQAASLPESQDKQDVLPRPLPLELIAEYPEFFVVAKPPKQVVHPARGHYDDTLANAIAAYCPRAGALPRAGVVHRLDKDTSGVMVVARTSRTRQQLINQFKERSAKRRYLAIVHGCTPATGVIDRPIGRSFANRLKMAVKEGGRDAYTHYQKISATKCFSYLLCRIQSGRTHQIRVHLEYEGYPVAGDKLYKQYARNDPKIFTRQMLHAYTLELLHPTSGKPLLFRCSLPPDFANVVESFNWPKDPA